MIRICLSIGKILLLCAAVATAAAPLRDFIIIGNPAVVDLYDQFEQPLSLAQKRALPRNMPFEIVNARQTMGDQITEGMRLSHLGTTWYLLLDEKGKIAGLPTAASLTRYRGCTVSNDTLTVAQQAIKLYERTPPGGAVATVTRGEKLLRVFTCGSAVFFFRAGTPALFGWSSAPKDAFSAGVKPLRPIGDDFAILHERIMKRLADANKRYDSLFRYFTSTASLMKR